MAQAANSASTVERYALYYPYIHIRSENWLKATLLSFQQVRRIVPSQFTLRDQETTAAYAQLEGPSGPLLKEAHIGSKRVANAQLLLRDRLERSRKQVVARYSLKKTPKEFREGPDTFQIHRMKILDLEFAQWLVDQKLAWNSRDQDEADWYDWLTMHPRLGAGIMSILALAIARDEGLHIVTPSRRAHAALLATKEDDVLETLLEVPGRSDAGDAEQGATVEELSQVVLTTTFDLTRLNATDIRDLLVEGHKDLRAFHDSLNTFTQRIPTGLGEEERMARMKKEADAVLEQWRECTRKLPQLRESLTDATLEKAPEKLVEAGLKTAGEAAGATLLSGIIGHVPGIILSIVVSAGAKMFKKKDTPLRFLNRVEKAVDSSIGSLYVPQWRALTE